LDPRIFYILGNKIASVLAIALP